MKIRVIQSRLKITLEQISKAFYAKPVLPVVSCVRITAKDGVITFALTNLDIWCECILPGQIEEEGEAVVNFKLFKEVVVAYTNYYPVTISTDVMNKIKIETERMSSNINGFPTDEYPDYQPDSETIALIVSARDFMKAFGYVSITAAVEDNRPVLQYIRTTFKNDQVEMVTCDGVAMSKMVFRTALPVDMDISILLKAKELETLLKSKQDSELLHIFIGEKDIRFSHGLLTLVVKRTPKDFVYPGVDAIIPKVSTFLVDIERGLFLTVIKQALVMARDYNNTVLFETKTDSISVTAGNNENKNTSTIPLLDSHGTPFDFKASGVYLKKFLEACDTERIQMHGEPMKALTFQSVEEVQKWFLLMPIG